MNSKKASFRIDFQNKNKNYIYIYNSFLEIILRFKKHPVCGIPYTYTNTNILLNS